MVLLFWLLQDPWKLEFQTSVVETGDGWTFRVEGRTDLPPGTVLRARVYALDEVVDPQNGETIVDEEPLFYGDEAFQDFEVGDGTLSTRVYSLKRRPYSLRYRVRVIYDPDFQNKDVKSKVGGKEFQKDLDLREGDDAKHAEELKATGRELYDEFVRVKELFEDLKREFASQRKKYDPEAWNRWLDPWMDKLQEVRGRNDDRYMLWTVWLERQGKLRIEGFCMRLPELASDCREFLEGNAEVLARAQFKMESFLDYYEEAIEVVGLEMPLDLETIVPALAAYEKQVDRMKAIPAAEWSKQRVEVKREARQALLTVAGVFERRKKGYYRVNRIMAQFMELFRLADRAAESRDPEPAESLRKALESHDLDLHAFKSYAGLKE